MRIDVLGVGFDNLTLEEAVEAGMDLVRAPGAHYVVTPNPEIVEVCREDPTVMDIVNRADLVLADGIGVIKGAAMLGTPLKGKVPGIESVSYTHLDVYKRQLLYCSTVCWLWFRLYRMTLCNVI